MTVSTPAPVTLPTSAAAQAGRAQQGYAQRQWHSRLAAFTVSVCAAFAGALSCGLALAIGGGHDGYAPFESALGVLCLFGGIFSLVALVVESGRRPR